MHELGVINLRDAIVAQAVDDYCMAVKRLASLNMKAYSVNKIMDESDKGRGIKCSTMEEAEEERQKRIMLKESQLYDIERFFFSQWFRELSNIDREFILEQTKEKAIDELVWKCISSLNRVTEKNLHTKKSQRALFEYEILKNFLNSAYLPQITERSAEEILRYIKENVRKRSCDFFV